MFGQIPQWRRPRVPRQALLKEHENGRLFGPKIADSRGELLFGLSSQPLHQTTIKIGFQNDGMHVAPAADRRGIPEHAGDRFDCPQHVAFRLPFGSEFCELLQRPRGKNRSRPSAKILRGEVGTRDFSQVVVDVS